MRESTPSSIDSEEPSAARAHTRVDRPILDERARRSERNWRVCYVNDLIYLPSPPHHHARFFSAPFLVQDKPARRKNGIGFKYRDKVNLTLTLFD